MKRLPLSFHVTIVSLVTTGMLAGCSSADPSGAPGSEGSRDAAVSVDDGGHMDAPPANDAGRLFDAGMKDAAAPDARVSFDAGADANGQSRDAGTTSGDSGSVLDSGPGQVDAAGGDDAAAPSGDAGLAFTPGLHVVMGGAGGPGHIVDGAGRVVQLHGANRSGTEFDCLSGAFSDGPADQADIDAMKRWKINAVRVPMNEDCWLGINLPGNALSSATYQAQLETWVSLITSNDMVAIIDLHWTAGGTTLSNAQAAMADADHAPTFWSQVAGKFKSNGLVIFDLFNEPFVTGWDCWLKGGSGCAYSGNGTLAYPAAGMAQLLQAVRNAGADNVVILGGLSWSSDMSSWVSSVNSIPTLAAPLNGISIANVAASWHSYDFNGQSGCASQYNGYSASNRCNSPDQTAKNTSASSVLAGGFPFVMGETGISLFSTQSAASFSSAQQGDIQTWFDAMLTWTEQQGQSYVAWSWDTDTTPVLVSDYSTYAPTPYFGATYQTHLKKF